jgi:hypothetical protein
MSARVKRSLIIVAVVLVGGIVLTAVRDDGTPRDPAGVIDRPTSPSSVSAPPVTAAPLSPAPTTTAASGRGPITATCTPNGDGSFVASFTSPWADGVVEQGTATITGNGLKTVTGDRGTISYYFIKVVDGHPSCLDYN